MGGPKYGNALPVAEHADKHQKAYQDREVSMNQVYEQTLKIVQELLSRVEHEMFRGMQYKADQKGHEDWPKFDAKVTKAAEGLGKLVVSLQGSHLRLLKEGEKQRKNMSIEAKMDYTVNFIQKLPKSYQAKVREALGW